MLTVSCVLCDDCDMLLGDLYAVSVVSIPGDRKYTHYGQEPETQADANHPEVGSRR